MCVTKLSLGSPGISWQWRTLSLQRLCLWGFSFSGWQNLLSWRNQGGWERENPPQKMRSKNDFTCPALLLPVGLHGGALGRASPRSGSSRSTPASCWGCLLVDFESACGCYTGFAWNWFTLILCLSQSDVLFKNIFFKMFIDLDAPGFSCSIWDLWCSFWHAASLVTACGFLVPDQGSNPGPLH